MVAPKHGSVKAVIALAAVMGFALACASTMTEPTGPEVSELTDVAVESGEEITVVTLVGLADPIYTTEYDADTQTVVYATTSAGIKNPFQFWMKVVKRHEVQPTARNSVPAGSVPSE